ncbi:helix-turn-helix domain-containing protein [Bombella sp. TMW 2.2543]|uniref:Helix-turn-helix domain-containing protein n=1 Tax=Bombella pluederhausensis TaxID=2967336 RepID=A0ABT3WHW9_9PROT|nr:helix-turn-helix transcriptional regulator [Bombella pluederhausensis]MCX5618488.1 helix-turn-helix domain-containing protein [Bombella pluederhausensis]
MRQENMYDRALKTIRQYHRLSQSDLAKQINISRSYLNEIEHKKKEPSLAVLKKYADRFELPISSLMLFAEQESNKNFNKARIFFADKVLKMLEWVADGENNESKKTSATTTHTD